MSADVLSPSILSPPPSALSASLNISSETVDLAVLHPLFVSLAAQPVLGDLLQLSHALAEHLEGGDQSSVPVREDFGRGLCDGRGVHGGCWV